MSHHALRRALSAASVAALFAGCSSGSTVLTPQTKASPPSGPPTPTPVGPPVGTPVPTVSTSFVVTFPSGTSGPKNTSVGRRVPAAGNRQTLDTSSATESILIAVTDSSNHVKDFTFDVGPTSPGCVDNGQLVCTEPAAVPVGRDRFAVTTYSGPNETGSILSTATIAQTISATSNNKIALSLGGVVASIFVSLDPSTVHQNHGQKVVAVDVTAKDASGSSIVGNTPYAQPIALSVDATSAPHAKLSATSVASPADTNSLTLTYDGSESIAASTVSASTMTAGVAPASATLNIIQPELPSFSVPSLSFTSTTASSQSFGTSEDDYNGTFVETDTCANIASVVSIDDMAFNVEPINVGSCSIAVSDSYGNTSQLPVTVTSTAITVQ